VNLIKLNGFSKKIYHLLSLSYPNWVSQIKNMPNHEDALVIKIPSPQDGERVLIIDTLNEEITVQFEDFHSHFGWSDVPDEEAFQRAKKMIDGIIGDKLLIASIFRNGKWGGSTTLNLEELEEFRIENPEFNIIVSWSKNY
jgi:hypothetical protein